jgi:NitT/TauT family transport system substrate-binding protein
VDEDAITAVPVAPITGMSSLLRDRKVDAVTIWEPEAEKSAAALGQDAIVFQDRRLYRELFNLQTSTKVLADPSKRRALVTLLRSLIAASASLRDHPRDLWPLLSSKLNYTEATIGKSWPQLRYAGSMAGDLLDVLVEEDRWVAKEKARAPRTREQLAALIDRSLLDEARRGAAK